MTIFDEIRFFITALEKAIAAGTPVDVWEKRLEKLYDEGQMSTKARDVVLAVAKEFKPKAPPKAVTKVTPKPPVTAPKVTVTENTQISGGCGSIRSSCAVSSPDPCSRGGGRIRGGC